APAVDWGDAPDPDYETLLASDGARHIIVPTLYLGSTIDGEEDGQPDANATGDDLAGGDDEDGVAFTSAYEPGETMTLTVTASQAGKLHAWVDFNDDGDWTDPGEQIFVSVSLVGGPNDLSFEVPEGASVEDSTFARFRFSSDGGLSCTGAADDGEVEDYELSSRQSIELSLKAGWNMVSVPVQAADMSTSAVFPGADAVYTWNAIGKSYSMPTTIAPEEGYWVAVSTDQIVIVEGTPVDSWEEEPISAGWNMIGSVCGESVDFSNPADAPDGSVEGFAYAWDPLAKSYSYTTTIEPGKGYWIAATQECTLTLPPPGA
ncbi:MAG: hypothetical protein KAQ74_05725, partial [Dehalococcoidia bacterium]|nr:hypothetical protein [Dehalococcoidia bacterium]